MSNYNAILDTVSLQVIDQATNTYRVNSPVGAVTLGANMTAYYESTVASGAGTSIVLPATTVWAVFVRNRDAAANITVQMQVTGGSLPSAANSPIIVPSGVFIYWNPTEGAGGVTALTLISSVGNTGVEILLAA